MLSFRSLRLVNSLFVLLLLHSCCDEWPPPSETLKRLSRFTNNHAYIYANTNTGELDTLYTLESGTVGECDGCAIGCCNACQDYYRSAFYKRASITDRSQYPTALHFDAGQLTETGAIVGEYLNLGYEFKLGQDTAFGSVNLDFVDESDLSIGNDSCVSAIDYPLTDTFSNTLYTDLIRIDLDCTTWPRDADTPFLRQIILQPGLGPVAFTMNSYATYRLVKYVPIRLLD